MAELENASGFQMTPEFIKKRKEYFRHCVEVYTWIVREKYKDVIEEKTRKEKAKEPVTENKETKKPPTRHSQRIASLNQAKAIQEENPEPILPQPLPKYSQTIQKRLRSKFASGVPVNMRFIARAIKELMMLPGIEPFCEPVDPILAGAPDYFKVIEEPRDLGTIKKKIEDGGYNSCDEVKADVQLVWNNSRKYNPEPHILYLKANEFEASWKEKLEQLPQFVKENRTSPTEEELSTLSSKDISFIKVQVSSQMRRVRKHSNKQKKQREDGAWDEAEEEDSDEDYGPSKQRKYLSGMSRGYGGSGRGVREEGSGGSGRSGEGGKEVSGKGMREEGREERDYDLTLPGDEEELSFDEVKAIRDQIEQLDEEEVGGFLDIIQANELNDDPERDSENIEIDLEKMSSFTLHKIQRYLSQVNASKANRFRAEDDGLGHFGVKRRDINEELEMAMDFAEEEDDNDLAES
ncbi:putative bromodomain-containing factor 1 [Monocercomonoides exilis]|uniref:putative bromodomain-containing factor 1 n=1 Tax=Monocercomonoides exilis TaxID=2049356 RepID=UPI0035597895|nr:putative bromodomain-containing factor 1 [Monocercomonoides exilis]|eukprot:MONOS_2581.1-p1 / transcript=MONOS_2581.1 / gene=MONOS_2581 / organism=Monocercomonoides_exilis_PA203 / gene_product=unspecified product / transcript_product=unspecified product / location=Mono_scaffold00054:60403-61962(-) / protein_length=463 / sequence_SO=supercontig / SO=protein_coding / is_pseudo=false